MQENKIDYLDEDPTISGQTYVCLSFLTPETIKSEIKFDTRGVKVRGVYDSYEKAEKRCVAIRKFDPSFNIYIAEVGKWLAFADNPEMASDENYANNELNKLMKNYKEDQENAKQHHEDRKQEFIKKTKKTKKSEKKYDNNDNLDIDSMELEMKQKKDELNNAKKIIQEKEELTSKIFKEMKDVEKELKKKKEY
jgi:hypothetical protein